MASSNHKMSILLLLCIVFALLPKSHAGIAKYDEYLKKRAKQSYEESLEAFDPNPETLADELNEQVGETLISENVTRRLLKEDSCKATNPIDRCWRCDPNWAKNRKNLVDCVRGFGHRATGGKNGRYYVVTNPSDDDMDKPKAGTLRHAFIQPEPLWIIFSGDMVIRLKQELIFASDKTIDGRGVQVRIAYGAGITLQFVHNVIIHNIWIHNIVPADGGMIRDAVDHVGLRTRSDGDAISIFGSNNIWIDHVSMSKATDGLVDAIEGSTAITISNCKFNHHDGAVEEYAAEMEKLAFKLLELIALSLGLQKDRLNGLFEDQTSRMRINYYPPCPIPDLALGVGRHKDGGALTILAQDDVGGLQVKRKTDGEWILVKPTPDAYIINVGDIIQVWSNEKYESIEHRAMVNSEKERFSIPYFFNPAHDTWVEPLEELINQQSPAKYKGYNWGKFLVTRNRGNFKKLDVENIQISHFRI